MFTLIAVEIINSAVREASTRSRGASGIEPLVHRDRRIDRAELLPL